MLIGTVAWGDPSIAALIKHGKAIASTHRMCHVGEKCFPENNLPRAGSYCMYCTADVKWNACSCEKNTEHCKDYDDIRDRPYATERRLKVHASMIGHLFNHTRSLWSTSEGSGRRHVLVDDERWNKESREAFPLAVRVTFFAD